MLLLGRSYIWTIVLSILIMLLLICYVSNWHLDWWLVILCHIISYSFLFLNLAKDVIRAVFGMLEDVCTQIFFALELIMCIFQTTLLTFARLALRGTSIAISDQFFQFLINGFNFSAQILNFWALKLGLLKDFHFEMVSLFGLLLLHLLEFGADENTSASWVVFFEFVDLCHKLRKARVGIGFLFVANHTGNEEFVLYFNLESFEVCFLFGHGFFELLC